MSRVAAGVVGLSLVFALPLDRASASGMPFDKRVDAIRAQLLTNPDSALRNAVALRSDAAAINSDGDTAEHLGSADWLRAEALISLNRPNEAMRVIRSSLNALSRRSSASIVRGELYKARAGARSMLGDVPGALADYQSAYTIFSGRNDAREQAIALQGIARIYTIAGDYHNALKYQRQSVEIYQSDPTLLLSAYNIGGIANFELGHYRWSAEQYLLALKQAERLGSPLLQARILQNLARTQAGAGDLAAAETSINRAYALTASGPAASWRPSIYGVAAEVALKRNQLDRAASLIQRTFAEAGTAQAAMPMRDFHRTAYEIFRQRGDTADALTHLEAFKKLDDQERAVTASTNAALMSARFDFANQEVKISRLRAEQAESQVRFHNVLTKVLLSVAAVISTLLLIGFLSIRRSRNRVREANATLRVTNTALEKALAAKTEFLATTSHEIRTPLNGILGMTQVILAGRSLDPPLRSRIELVHAAGETMKALVDDILDVAKMETGELRIQAEQMDLKRLLTDAITVWTGQAETKRIGIAFDLDDCPTRIIADEVRLRQIIFNLMSNAIKFTDRGQVRLTAAAEPGAEGEQGERLVVRVADSGIGIPADRLGDIFESFRQVDGGVTRRHGGTGLGLAICRNLARAMGGDVTVESVLGAGSTFTLTLPLVRGEPEVPVNDRAAAISFAFAKLLVIEPNPLGQGILRALLAGQCATVTFASDIAAAESMLAGEAIDHVVAEGSGLELDAGAAGALARRCAAAGSRFSLLWRTPTADQIAEFTEQGVAHVIAKPISAPDLLSALNSLYDARVPSRDIAA